MKNLKFNLPIWLLVLGLTFGLWGCQKQPEGDPDRLTRKGNINFALVDRNLNNICKSKQNSPYDLDYVHIIMHDGYKVEDLSYYLPGNSQDDLSHPSARGMVFTSNFLYLITVPAYKKEHEKYSDKPFYLILSPSDTDTLLWNSEEKWLYHNGKRTLVDYSPIMLRKNDF